MDDIEDLVAWCCGTVGVDCLDLYAGYETTWRDADDYPYNPRSHVRYQQGEEEIGI